MNGTVISSPNFPMDYDNLERCNFSAVAPPDHLVMLIFDSFDVEYEPSCLWDSVQVSTFSDLSSKDIYAMMGYVFADRLFRYM